MGVGFRRVTLGSPVAVPALPIPAYPRGFVNPWWTLSAVATFYAPSDISGIGGMRREHIRAVKSWRKAPGRYDTIFINTDANLEGMQGLEIARVQLFFSFSYNGVNYPCALVHWFSHVGDSPSNNTGMWVVEPNMLDNGESLTSIFILILSFEHHTFFQCLVLNVFQELFHSQTHSIHLTDSMLTNILTTMHSK